MSTPGQHDETAADVLARAMFATPKGVQHIEQSHPKADVDERAARAFFGLPLDEQDDSDN